MDHTHTRPWPFNSTILQAHQFWSGLSASEREAWLRKFRGGHMPDLREWEEGLLKRAADTEKAAELARGARPAKRKAPERMPSPAKSGAGMSAADIARVADAVAARITGTEECESLREAMGKAGISAVERGRLAARYIELIKARPTAAKLITQNKK